MLITLMSNLDMLKIRGAGGFLPISLGATRREGFRRRREARARFREQIRLALEGPQAEELRTILEPLPVDSVQPLYERVDLDALTTEMRSTINIYYEAAAIAKEVTAKARQAEEDDEDVLLLGM